MRSTQITLWTLTLALLTAAASEVRAQAADVRAIKPIVMLMVDTSGSMERMPDAFCDGCMPSCNEDPVNDQQNRWASTVQALTGTINNFKCKEESRTGAGYLPTDYDYGYFMPHHRIIADSGQLPNGILDAYKFRAKFGLMTFDGVGTSLTESPLVELDRWVSHGFDGVSNGQRGMYSYGDYGVLAFPGCTTEYAVNTGARSGTATGQGGLIAPPLLDDEHAVVGVNEAIQSALLGAGPGQKLRPFGGTPIAGMLEDLQYFLANDPNVGMNDPLDQCRDKIGVLITDGRPDSDFRGGQFNCEDTGNPNCPPSGCKCPYREATTIAGDLCAASGGSCGGALDKLFVVGFSLTDTDVIDSLDAIASAGGTGQAIIANGIGDLQNALGQVLDLAAPDATSRTLTQLSRQARSSGAAQYEVTAGFRLGDGGAPWEGILERKRYTCTDNTVVENILNPSQGDLFHITLSQQGATNRRIYTVDPGGTNADGTLQTAYSDSLQADATWSASTNNTEGLGSTNPPDPGDTSGEGDATEVTGAAPVRFSAGAFTHPEYFDPIDGGSGTASNSDLQHIMEWMIPSQATLPNGDTNHRYDRPLGAIYHSNPIIMEPPLANTQDSALNAWRGQPSIAGRPSVVFVGSNDGILHAFSLEDWSNGSTSFSAGEEMWGFVPPAVMDMMASATNNHQILMDGTPVIRDVLLSRNADDQADSSNYRTVLVMALRGTPNVFALDVTNPEDVSDANPPKLLWQFSHPTMGATFGTPAVTQVQVNWGGNIVEHTVAIIPGGNGEEDDSPNPSGCDPDGKGMGSIQNARAKIRCWKRVGRQLYMVDVASGELIQHFDERHFNAPLTGGIALDTSDVRDVARAAYFVDHDGVVWRLYLGTTDASKWSPEPIYDLFYGAGFGFDAGRGSTYPPLVTQNADGDNVIVTGTGDMDHIMDPATHRMFSLTDRMDIDANGNLTTFNVTENWKMDLEMGELVTGPLALFEEGVYFGTFRGVTNNSNHCDLGYSRLWGVHMDAQDPDSVSGHPAPMLTNPTDPESGVRNIRLNNLMVQGVQILQRPSCTPGGWEYDSVMGSTRYQSTGATGGGGFELRATVSGDDAGSFGATTGGSGTVQGAIGKFAGSSIRQMRVQIGTRKAHTRVRGWASSLE